MKNLISSIPKSLFLIGLMTVHWGLSKPTDDGRPTQVNKKFLVTLHITQDIDGNPSVDAARLEEIKNVVVQGGNYFAPIGMSFQIGDVHYIDNYNFHEISDEGELSEMSKKYDQPHRINLFVFARFVDDMEGGCGIAFGDNTSTVSAMFMAEGCVNPASFAHETGHFFGLPHTFPDTPTTELVDGSNCSTTADEICDTPADPYVNGSGITYVEDCKFVYDLQDANGDYYEPDITNIMSYYFEGCDCGLRFSNGQFEVIAATYFANKDRW